MLVMYITGFPRLDHSMYVSGYSPLLERMLMCMVSDLPHSMITWLSYGYSKPRRQTFCFPQA